jgi:hypothetical protein
MIAYKLMALCFVMCINNNRSTVGGKPALVGTKIKQVYHRGEGYFEIETDICSSLLHYTYWVLSRSVVVEVLVVLTSKQTHAHTVTRCMHIGNSNSVCMC